MFWGQRGPKKDPENEGKDPPKKRGGILRALKWIFWLPVLLLKWLLASLLFVSIAVGCAVAGIHFSPQIMNYFDGYFSATVDARLGTTHASVERLRDPTYFVEESEVISEDGKSLSCISSAEHRIRITDPADIPATLRNAIVASEDQDFFRHSGIDPWAITRAVLETEVLKRSASGASTITMQVAKNLRGGMGRRATKSEKIQDIVMALRIERELSKNEILLRYVNMPYFGRGAYGVEAASRAYFGKPIKELELHQTAFLVALLSKPALPQRIFAETSDEKQKAAWREAVRLTRRVLTRMSEEGSIDDIEFTRASQKIDRSLRGEIQTKWTGCGANNYFAESVRITLKDRFPLNRGGLTISITRDDALQGVLEQVVKSALDTYLLRHEGEPENAELRAGAFAVEFTGDVLAMVGNVDFAKVKYNVVTQGWRQGGSTFKVFTYGAYVEELTRNMLAQEVTPLTMDELVAGVMSRCTVLDAPIGVSMGRGRGVKMIQNFRSAREPLYRGVIPCRQALGESRNTAAMRAGAGAGIKNVIDLTYRLGMPKDPAHLLQPYPTTAIGASEVNPLGMVGAAAFVNGGFKVTPRFVNDVCKEGKSLIAFDEFGLPRDCDKKGEYRPSPERVLHPVVAEVMANVLQGPLEEVFGTARSLRTGIIPGMDPLSPDIWKLKPDERRQRTLAFPIEQAGEIAGKTGTATNADGKTSDVWLLLFIPGPPERPEKGIMLGFWMGKDTKKALGERGTGTTKGFAESGGRIWTHAVAPLLKFLQTERGLLKPGNRFQPIHRDELLEQFESRRHEIAPTTETPDTEIKVIDPNDPTTDPELLKKLNEAEREEGNTAEKEGPTKEGGDPRVSIPND